MIFVVNFVECHYSNKASASTAAYAEHACTRLYAGACRCREGNGIATCNTYFNCHYLAITETCGKFYYC